MGLEPDVVTFNCLIDAYAKAVGRPDVNKVVKTLELMKARGLKLGKVTKKFAFGVCRSEKDLVCIRRHFMQQ